MTSLSSPVGSRAPRGTGPRLRMPATRSGLTWLAVLLVVGALLAIQVGRQVYANYSITQQAQALREQISDIKARNGALRQQLDYLHSDAFVSAEARRLANVGHAGDRLLIIPPGSEARLPAVLVPKAAPDKPLLDQWIALFLGG